MATHRFSFTNNFSNTFKHTHKVGVDFVPFRNPDFAKSYAEGDLYVVLPLKSALCDCICNLVILARPDSLKNLNRAHPAETHHVWDCDASFGAYGDNDPMFRCITKFVYCKEKITSPLVWLERRKQRLNLIREALASTIYSTFEISGGLTKREIEVVRIGQSSEPRNRNGGQIQGRAQILNSVNCVLCEAAWERFEKFELVPLVNSVGIRIDDSCVLYSLEKQPGAPLELGDPFVSPSDSEFSVLEFVTQSL